jgi:hypothetical protein
MPACFVVKKGSKRWGWASGGIPFPVSVTLGPAPAPRVFGFDVLVCDRRAGPRRILGAVTEPHAVRRLLAALGFAAEPPPGRPVPAA